MMTSLFLRFAVIVLCCLPLNLFSQSIKTTTISFPILQGKMNLSGVVSHFENVRPDAPILVLVSPPQPISRDYHGFFKALSDSLNAKGFVTFRYDNRNFSDTLSSSQPSEDRFALYDGADDLHDALAFLRSDPRFSHHPIGVIGHSEGASSAMVEASRNAAIKRLFLLSTTGVSGERMAYTQIVSRIEPQLSRMTAFQRNIMQSIVYLPIHIWATTPDNETAALRIKEELQRLYDQYHQDLSQFLGQTERGKFVEMFMPSVNEKRQQAFIRFNPANYLPSVQCPIFIAYGKYDNLLRYDENKDAMERILMEHRRLDFKSVVIDKANHEFEDWGTYVPPYVSVHRKEGKHVWGKAFSTLLKSMADWLQE